MKKMSSGWLIAHLTFPFTDPKLEEYVRQGLLSRSHWLSIKEVVWESMEDIDAVYDEVRAMSIHQHEETH